MNTITEKLSIEAHTTQFFKANDLTAKKWERMLLRQRRTAREWLSAYHEKFDCAEWLNHMMQPLSAPPKTAEKPVTSDRGARIAMIKADMKETFQPHVIAELPSLLDDIISERAEITHMFFSGYSGLGKTELVWRISRWLPDFKVIKLPACLTRAGLAEVLAANAEENTPCIFFIDEAHSMEKAAREELKRATETGGRIETFTVRLGGETFEYTINPKKHLFILASNSGMRDVAIVGQSGRFMEIPFLVYNEEAMRAMYRKIFPRIMQGLDVTLTASVEKVLVKNTRPFPRSIIATLKKLVKFVKEGNQLKTRQDAIDIIQAAGLAPEGWNERHIQILRYMAETPGGKQLQTIVRNGCPGVDVAFVMVALEELKQADYVVDLTKGSLKEITSKGVAYLMNLDKAE